MSSTEARIITTTEFHALIAHDPNAERRLELIGGEVFEKMPTVRHGWIVAFFVTEIMLYLRQNPLGWVVTESRHAAPDDVTHSLLPDVAFIHRERGHLVESGAAGFMPDLVVEVQSPGQSDKLMSDKAAYYLARGTRMVWLVYPALKLVEVLTPDERLLLQESQTLSGGEVLPGLSSPVRDIFKDNPA